MRLPALSFVALLALSGCSWLGMEDWFDAPPEEPQPVEQPQAQNTSAFPYEMMAPEAPPAKRVESRGTPPGNVPDEYAWRSGHWRYKEGTGFFWNPGYWIRKPAFTAVWQDDLWMERTYGWTLVPGHWL